MSINAIEKSLWQASVKPADAQRLREDTESYLKTFRLDERERALVSSWDVRGLADLGVHAMVLMMAYAAVNGVEASQQYIVKINSPAGSSR